MPAHSAPTSIATTTMTVMCSGSGSETGRADDRGAERREAVLAVDADVEQVHPEADGDGERGQVVGRCAG